MNDAFCPRGSGGGDSGLTRFDYANDNEFKIVFLIRRSLVVVCYLIVHILSKYRIQRSRESQSVSLLIMPSYVMYLLCMLVYVIITAILGYMVLDGWPLYTYVALDVGIDVFFRNSLLAFFAQPGAGRQNFRAAFTVGVGVGAAYAANTMVSAIFYSQGNLQVALIIHVAFRLCYTFFGLFLYLIPRDKFFRREAFQALMLVSVVENTCGISYSIMTRNAATYSTCYVNVMTTVVSGLLGPLTTLYCLNLDSQYWQGMLSCEANPLQGMRDMWTIDAEVASALQNPRSTESEAQAGNKCPVLHFGKIRINYDLGVVSGGFSKVYFGSYCGKKVAIKMLFVMELTPQSIRDFYKEAQVLMVLRGEQVIECKGVTVMPPAIAVIMEYCRLGSLYTFLYENSQVSLDRERVTSVDSIRSQVFEMRTTFSTNPNVQMPVEVTMMLDAAQAVAFIHSKGYLHCDMKSLNYLVTDNLRLKISDVGEAVMDSSHRENKPAPKAAVNWCPPEVLVPGATGASYTRASDVFGLTMILSEILLKKLPLDDLDVLSYSQWYNAIVADKRRPDLSFHLPPEVAEIIELGWHTEPSQRPSAQQIVDALSKLGDQSLNDQRQSRGSVIAFDTWK